MLGGPPNLDALAPGWGGRSNGDVLPVAFRAVALSRKSGPATLDCFTLSHRFVGSFQASRPTLFLRQQWQAINRFVGCRHGGDPADCFNRGRCRTDVLRMPLWTAPVQLRWSRALCRFPPPRLFRTRKSVWNMGGGDRARCGLALENFGRTALARTIFSCGSTESCDGIGEPIRGCDRAIVCRTRVVIDDRSLADALCFCLVSSSDRFGWGGLFVWKGTVASACRRNPTRPPCPRGDAFLESGNFYLANSTRSNRVTPD